MEAHREEKGMNAQICLSVPIFNCQQPTVNCSGGLKETSSSSSCQLFGMYEFQVVTGEAGASRHNVLEGR